MEQTETTFQTETLASLLTAIHCNDNLPLAVQTHTVSKWCTWLSTEKNTEGVGWGWELFSHLANHHVKSGCWVDELSGLDILGRKGFRMFTDHLLSTTISAHLRLGHGSKETCLQTKITDAGCKFSLFYFLFLTYFFITLNSVFP